MSCSSSCRGNSTSTRPNSKVNLTYHGLSNLLAFDLPWHEAKERFLRCSRSLPCVARSCIFPRWITVSEVGVVISGSHSGRMQLDLFIDLAQIGAKAFVC